jgi:hypothetical protein
LLQGRFYCVTCGCATICKHTEAWDSHFGRVGLLICATIDGKIVLAIQSLAGLYCPVKAGTPTSIAHQWHCVQPSHVVLTVVTVPYMCWSGSALLCAADVTRCVGGSVGQLWLCEKVAIGGRLAA